MLIKKCNNTSGASIFIALLFLLMCSLAGSTILTAASTSSGRLVNLKKDEQSYYAVTSAARLLKKEIEGEKYSRYKIISKSGEINDYNEKPSKDLKDFLQKAADEVYESRRFEDSWIIKTSESVIEDVVAHFSIDEQYNITINLSQGNRHYTLKVPAAVSERTEKVIDNTNLDEVNTKITTSVIWTKGEIYKN